MKTDIPRTNEIAHAGLDLDTYTSRMTELAREIERENARLQMELDASCNAEELRQARAENARLREENERLLDAIRQTVGWNESVGNNTEDVRLLHDILSNDQGEAQPPAKRL